MTRLYLALRQNSNLIEAKHMELKIGKIILYSRRLKITVGIESPYDG